MYLRILEKIQREQLVRLRQEKLSQEEAAQRIAC